ncbi:PIN domain-containing protein [Micromonospora soli]|uniref:PIN domain-containing protein n=1 Tax=Micromonospora sp. NBRC 110009 TaxID=3061627 RepID=UPI0026737AC7|nr:PIN domain-containing protein [Micromonospora sp. NBRC 110009]WKT99957.1 PIN domain-containing protein [Micromonospora sp. NBRC 110009]
MFTALLDTCVLWPNLQRDFLLSLAIEGMYRPVWSGVVLEELEYEQAAKLVAQGREVAEAARWARYLIEQMRRHFDDAEVHGWEGLEGTYGLPDPDDEHLVAAAVVANAGAIITLNVRDLPAIKIPAGLQVLSPQEFAANIVSLDP